MTDSSVLVWNEEPWKAFVPNIPGIYKSHVMSAIDLLEGKRHAGKNVVIVGGNMIGCETAEFLAEYNKKVTILEMTNEIGLDIAVVPKPHNLAKLSRLGVDMVTGATVTSIEDEQVNFKHDGEVRVIRAVDTVVIATGMKSDNNLYEELKGAINDKPIHLLGDAAQVARIMDCLTEVYDKLLVEKEESVLV